MPSQSGLTGPPFVIPGLTSGTDYQARVRAVNAAGNNASPPTPFTTTVPSGGGGGGPYDFAFGMDATDIQALPTGNAAYTNMKAMADATYAYKLVGTSAGGVDGISNAFCGGLEFVRSGNTAYRTKVNDFLDAIQATDESTWYYQVPNRKLGIMALTGQLVGRETSHPGWLDWLAAMRYQNVTGHGRSPNMHQCAWDWGNNHGMGARTSHIMVDAVIGDLASTAPDGNPSGLSNAVKWYKASLGDKSEYGCWADDRQEYGGLGKTASSYQDQWAVNATNWSPLNASTTVYGSSVSTSKEGLFCPEAFRENTNYSTDVNGRPIFGSDGNMYHYESGGYVVYGAAVLAANGYPDVWDWADQAVRRWRSACFRWGYEPQYATSFGIDHVLDKVYGTAFTQGKKSNPANGLTATDWLTLAPNWPVTA